MVWQNPKKRKLVLSVLVIANLIAFAVFYGMRWQHKRQERAYWLAKYLVMNQHSGGLFTEEEVGRKLDIEDAVHNKERLSDTDLEWCFRTMDAPAKNADAARSRRQNVVGILMDGTDQMSLEQKDRLFAEMTAMMKKDDPKDEMAIDAIYAADVFLRLKDRRALPLLQSLLADKRFGVPYAAQDAINHIEGCKEGCKAL